MGTLRQRLVAGLVGAAVVFGVALGGAQQPADDPYGPAPSPPPPPAATTPAPVPAATPPAPVPAATLPAPVPPPAATPPAAVPPPVPVLQPKPVAPPAPEPVAGEKTEPDDTAAPGARGLVQGRDAPGAEPEGVQRDQHDQVLQENLGEAREGVPGAHAEAHGDDHTDAHGNADAHGGHHGHHEAPGEINLAQGFLGESAEGPYGLLYRPEGMPPPLLALLLNTAVVFGVLYVFGRVPIQQALQQRRANIVRGMEEAAKMKAEAEVRLRVYEQRLDHLDDELERLKKEMREQAEAERERVLAEARTKREKMEHEARRMVELELKAAREQLQEAAVRDAVGAARELLVRELGSSDHRRLMERHLLDLQDVDLKNADLGGAL